MKDEHYICSTPKQEESTLNKKELNYEIIMNFLKIKLKSFNISDKLMT